MPVKLISYSQLPKDYAAMAAENFNGKMPDLKQIVAYCARVSNPGNQNNPDIDRLIDYLIEHKHWSPFEMVSVCMEIDTTRDIARQILRHRSFSFQEFSQRYADPTQDLSFTIREARLQDKKNRQNSIEVNNQELEENWVMYQNAVLNVARDAYRWARDNGIAKEQARAVLPEGLTNSRMYMNGTVRSWIHYIELRSGPETQKEHRQVAIDCAKELTKVFEHDMIMQRLMEM